jgi:hypothetical protein
MSGSSPKSQADPAKETPGSSPKSPEETPGINTIMLGEVLALLANNGTKYLIAHEALSNDGGTPPPDRTTIVKTIFAPNAPKKFLPHDNDAQKGLLDFIQNIFKGLVQPKSFLPATPGPDSNSATKNPWQLRVSEDKDFCYLPTQPLTLLLPESQSDKGVRATGGFARKETPNGEAKPGLWYLGQDAFTPATDDQASQLMGKAKSETITLHQIPEKLTTDKERATWMLEQKVCKRQAELLSAK